MPEVTVSTNQTATGLRCFVAIATSIVASLIVIVFGGLTLPHGALAWKLLGPLDLAIASAVLVAIVPGVNTFSRPTIQMMLVALIVVVILHFMRWHVKPDMNCIVDIKSYSVLGQVLSVIIICVISPIFEEIYYRGLLYPIMSIHLGSKLGAILSAMFFVLTHMSFKVLIATTILTLLVYRSRSIYPSMATHIAFNSILMVRMITWQA